jgi:hypothetical protein
LSDARTPSSTLAHAASHLAGTPAVAASYTGIGDNESFSDAVTITANTAGTGGNSITLSFDGVDDVDTVLAAWNAANPSNQATLDSGDGGQVPDDGDSLQLSGGVAAIAGGSDPFANINQDLGTTDDVEFASLNINNGEVEFGGSLNPYNLPFKVISQDQGNVQVAQILANNLKGIALYGTGLNSTDGPVVQATEYEITNDVPLYVNTEGDSPVIIGNIENSGEKLQVAGNVVAHGNMALRDVDNEFAATFDVQSQLSDDVTLTIPDQSGTLAIVTDIPTTAGDVGAVAAGAITTSGLTQATARILGRTTASTGAVEEIQIGSGLLLSAGELSATGGSGVTAVGATLADILSVSGSDLVADDLAADKLYGWDDSESKAIGFIIGSGLSVSGDTLSATASGGSKTYAVFTAGDNQPPATAFATLDTRNSIAVLDFDDATDESAVFVSIIPEAASLGSGLKIRLHWMATTATSGNVVWDVSLERMTTDLDSDSFDTIASGTAAANGTSGILTVTEITLTTIDSVTAGDGFRLKVTRDANNASDTMTGDAELVVCEVRSAA